jgi:hypothetical protein
MKHKLLIGGSIFIIIVIGMILFFQFQYFEVNRLEYSISDGGDALVTADYNLGLIESFTLYIPTVKNSIKDAIKSEYGPETNVIEITTTHTQFIIPKYATVYDTHIDTPSQNFENTKSRAQEHWFFQILHINYTPHETIITSFNATSYKYQNASQIPSVSLQK